jgi:phage terminase Nu1 subunit (DNA packaging protein)
MKVLTPMSKGKEVSQAELSDIIGKSQVTLRAWEREGMPVLSKAGKGRASTYNTVEVIEWMEARLISKFAASKEDDTDVVSEDEGRRRKIVAEAKLAELKLAVESGELVEIEAVGVEVDTVLSSVRARLLAIPGTLALTLTNEPDPSVVRDRVFDEISGALNELSAADLGRPSEATGATEAVEA